MKLSIGLIAYNHEKFIEQAIAGILAQRTDFEYEIIVGEDCSTDRTRAIVLELQAQHPDKIRLLDTPCNLGMNANYIRTFQACHGEYVALLDGDDYWCDETKLQQQIDFLDRNRDYSISFHPVRWTWEDGSHPDRVVRPRRDGDTFELDDLLYGMFVTTCSAVVRNAAVGVFPEWVYRMKTMDYPIMVLAAGGGKIGYIDQVMSVYRLHSGGAWSSMAMVDRLVTNILLLEHANPHYLYRYDATVRERQQHYWTKLANEFYDAVTAPPSWSEGRRTLVATQMKLAELNSTPPLWMREQLKRVLMYFLIHSYKSGAYQDAWACWMHLLRLNPAVIKNRGVVIMGAGSALGGRLQPALRGMKRAYRAVRPRKERRA